MTPAPSLIYVCDTPHDPACWLVDLPALNRRKAFQIATPDDEETARIAAMAWADKVMEEA